MADNNVLSVSALTAAVKGRLEGAFPFVWVRGQVSNLSRPASGHVYFSLRDEGASLAAVWFKGRQQALERFDPLTGEVYEDGPRPGPAASLENGREVVCAGRISVYAARGTYQLLVEIVQEAGLGRLHEEFERLRARLDALGYFAPERKRPLPLHPVRTAVLTAPSGAAIHDFLRLAEERGLGAQIRIHAVPVQGEAAPAAIIAALRRVWAEGWAEVAVLIRGGGSIEDLWAFNSAALAEAIVASPIPVLAGIGHEVDFTLADMTADVRAATPSHAAQLLWPSRDELGRRLRTLDSALSLAGGRSLERAAQRLTGLRRELAWSSPLRRLETWQERLASGLRLLDSAGRRRLEQGEARLRALRGGLSAAASGLPVRVARLDALAGRLHAAPPRSLERRADALRQLTSGLALAPARLPEACRACERLGERLETAAARRLEEALHGLERQTLRLEAVNPHAPLDRGYALARKADGSFVRLTQDVAAGEALRLIVSNGDIPVRVEGEFS